MRATSKDGREMLTIVRVKKDGRKLECWDSGADKPAMASPPESPYFYLPLSLLELPDEVKPFANVVMHTLDIAPQNGFFSKPKND